MLPKTLRPPTTLVPGMKIHANEGSFKDPMGRVYHVSGEHGDKIIRGLTRDGSATLKKLLTERFFQSLMSKGEVIGTHLLAVENSYARQIVGAGWHSAIEHDPVSFVSWPYEWPFSMLKDAALLQLSLLEESIAHGWMLKDATPFNVQWRGARPTFVDVTSFVPWDGRYWRAYRQFCATYLAPLLLTAHLGIPFQPLLRSRLEGLAADEAVRYFRGLSRFRRGVPSHILFPAVAERMSVRGAAPAKSRQRQSETMQRAVRQLAQVDIKSFVSIRAVRVGSVPGFALLRRRRKQEEALCWRTCRCRAFRLGVGLGRQYRRHVAGCGAVRRHGGGG